MSKRRKIIHIDMDAFYASVEQRDNPEYRNKPIAVGGMPTGRGGVVATASYEARKFGVRSAMPSRQAKERCPNLIFVRPRFEVYKSVSLHVREIFHRFTDLVEPLSLDEAYLDVSEDKLGLGSALDIARLIKDAIRIELQLTASAGVSVSKFVAKIASDMNKPDGLTFIGPSKVESFMESLPVEKFFGVGKVTASKMKRLGLFTGSDLKKLSLDQLKRHFGKSGTFFFNIVRGIDERPVIPYREAKSIGAEDTFDVDLRTTDEIIEELNRMSAVVADRAGRKNITGKTVTVKIKFNDFKVITRAKSSDELFNDEDTIKEVVRQIVNTMDLDEKRVRLVGVTLSNLDTAKGAMDEGHQLPLGL
ncbi:DNA polymerase IV [Chryseolinea sp. T2]|uniref:DNA polymerase IV n=1 Tax=Chryseolinea sp. T2 TaxID=3129255 RepID=UPI0030783AC2